jgi:hypothetical protein
MRLLLSVIAVALLSCVATAENDLRLAGTVSYGNGQWLAMVELPSGGQKLVRVNEPLAGGTVVAIADRVVRIRLPAGEKIYVLEGGKTIASWAVAERPAGAPIIASREIAPAFLQALDQVELRFGKSEPQVLHAELNKLLGIPPSSRVRAVNQSRMKNDAQLIAAIRREARAHNAVHLFLDNSPQLTEVYLLPQQK